MTELIISQLYILIFLLLLAGHDSSSIRLREHAVDALGVKRIKRWHRDGAFIYGMFCLQVAQNLSWWLLIPAVLIRLAFFDLAINYWTDWNINFIGTTATTDKFFAKIFGKNGAIKKSLFFFLILLLLNILFINKIKAQTFLGMGVTTNGITAGGGYQFKKIKNFDLEFDYRCPLKRPDISNTSSLLAGRIINLKLATENKSLGWFRIKYAAGIGYYRVQEFYKYNSENNFFIIQVTKFKPSFKVEASRRIADGIIYLSVNHCGIWWQSVGFKTILSNIKKHYQ